MEKMFKNKQKVLIVGSLTIIFGIIYKFMGIYYYINDDISMQNILSGTFSGSPEAHAVYIKYVLGIVFAFAYKITNKIDWYGIFMLGVSLVCYAMLIHRIYLLTEESSQKKWLRIFLMLALFAMCFRITVFFQYTTVAGVVGATATFLLITRKSDSRTSYDISIVMLYVIMYCIRSKVFWMMMPITCISLTKLFLESILTDKICKEQIVHGLKKNLRVLILIGVTIVFVASIREIETKAYSSDDWSSYRKFNSYRAQIVDFAGFPDYEQNKEFYTELGISELEYPCLKQMFGILPNVDEEVMGKIAALSQGQNQQQGLRLKAIELRELLETVVSSEQNREFHILLLLLIVVLLKNFKKYNKHDKCVVILSILAQGFIFAYLLWNGRFPSRVVQIFEIQCILSSLGILLNNLDNAIFFKRKAIWLSSIVLMLIMICSIFNNVEEKIDKQKISMKAYEEFKAYLTDNEDNVYVLQTGTVTTEKQFTFILRNKLSNTVGTRGWSSYSPYLKAKMNTLGIVEDIPLLLGNNVYYMTNSLEYAEWLNKYYQSIYEQCRDYKIVDEVTLSNGRHIYVCKW